MTCLLIRRILGISWFISLVVLAALLIIVMDANAESLRGAFVLPYLSSVLMLSLSISIAAMPSFLLYRQKRWPLGLFAAVITAVFSWALLQMLQTTPTPLSFAQRMRLLPKAIAILSGWIVLISLPSALLLDR